VGKRASGGLPQTSVKEMLAPSIASSPKLELKFELPGEEFYRLGESQALSGAEKKSGNTANA
jgi:hypothetical protein